MVVKYTPHIWQDIEPDLPLSYPSAHVWRCGKAEQTYQQSTHLSTGDALNQYIYLLFLLVYSDIILPSCGHSRIISNIMGALTSGLISK